MILSNVTIQRCLDDGDLFIDPEPSRTATIENPNCAYDTSSVNLRLASILSIPKKGKPFTFDLRQGGIARFLAEMYQNREVDEHGGNSRFAKIALFLLLEWKVGVHWLAAAYSSTSPRRPFTRALRER